MSIDNTQISHFLDSVLNLNFLNIEKNSNTSLNVYHSMGLGDTELVPFVMGLIYEELQRDFDNVCNRIQGRNATPDDLNKWFIPFWNDNVSIIRERLIKIYNL